MAHVCHTRTHADYLPEVGAEIHRFADAVATAVPTARVPSCPDWTVADLVEHTGTIHRWCAGLVRVRARHRIPPAEMGLDRPLSAEPAELAAWIRAGAATVLDALASAPADDPMWGWGADRHVRFWSRRMVHETAVHRADAEQAAGREPAMDPDLAVDAIDELLDNLPTAGYFAPRVDDLRGTGQTLDFRATDRPTTWRVTLEPDRFTWDHDGDGEADASLIAPVGLLLLALYRRLPVDDAGIDAAGNRVVLERWVSNTAL